MPEGCRDVQHSSRMVQEEESGQKEDTGGCEEGEAGLSAELRHGEAGSR